MPTPKNKSATSEEDLDKQRAELDDLRRQIAEAEQERLQSEAAQTNEILSAQLAAEKERLLAELSTAKATAKMSDAKDGGGTLAQARLSMQNAEAQRQAVEEANKARVEADANKNQES